jgi:hypothetical protein
MICSVINAENIIYFLGIGPSDPKGKAISQQSILETCRFKLENTTRGMQDIQPLLSLVLPLLAEMEESQSDFKRYVETFDESDRQILLDAVGQVIRRTLILQPKHIPLDMFTKVVNGRRETILPDYEKTKRLRRRLNNLQEPNLRKKISELLSPVSNQS